jgi:hypothetical protein
VQHDDVGVAAGERLAQHRPGSGREVRAVHADRRVERTPVPDDDAAAAGVEPCPGERDLREAEAAGCGEREPVEPVRRRIGDAEGARRAGLGERLSSALVEGRPADAVVGGFEPPTARGPHGAVAGPGEDVLRQRARAAEVELPGRAAGRIGDRPRGRRVAVDAAAQGAVVVVVVPARRRDVDGVAHREVDAVELHLGHLEVADPGDRFEVDAVEAIGGGAGDLEGLALVPLFERGPLAGVERGPVPPVVGAEHRPTLGVALGDVVRTGETVRADDCRGRELHLPQDVLRRGDDAPLRARLAVVRLADRLAVRRVLVGPAGRGDPGPAGEGDPQPAEVPVRPEARHARVERVVRLAGQRVVVVVHPSPEAVLVELDDLLVRVAEEHRPEPAVAYRQRLGRPVPCRGPVPQRPAGQVGQVRDLPGSRGGRRGGGCLGGGGVEQQRCGGDQPAELHDPTPGEFAVDNHGASRASSIG